MALSDDQRALLRLLAKQDEAYEAIAAATGASVEELKAKGAGAIEALEEDPPPPAAAEASSGAVPPATPPAAETSSPARGSHRAQSQPRSPVRVPGNRRLFELVGGTVVVLLLILFATGAIDVGGGDDSGDDGGQPALSGQLPASGSKRVTQAVLTGVDGSDATGRALFGRLKQQVLLVIAAKGLSPSGPDESYAISLVNADDERIPIAATRVGSNGAIATQIQVPATVLGALASGYDEMEVSLVVNDELEAALRQARGAKSAPQFDGTTVLRGEVTGPVVSGAQSDGG